MVNIALLNHIQNVRKILEFRSDVPWPDLEPVLVAAEEYAKNGETYPPANDIPTETIIIRGRD